VPINTLPPHPDITQQQPYPLNVHHPLPTPPMDTQPRSSKSLPNVSHVPHLTGRVDFGAWNDGVRTLILHMGLLGHIANPSPSGYLPLPMESQSEQPHF
jgi:hypothetical protein